MKINKNKNFIVELNRRFAWMKVVILIILVLAAGGIGWLFIKNQAQDSKMRASVAAKALENKRETKLVGDKGKEEEAERLEEEKLRLKKEEEQKKQEELKKQAEAQRIAVERETALRHKREAEEKMREVVAEKGGKKVIALTFDDGPNRATTPELLNILKQKGVKVTFFVLGAAARYGRDIVRRAFDEGHEIQGHTMTHGAFNAMTKEQIATDIAAADSLMTEIIGRKPEMIRPPYGAMSQAAKEVVGRPFICWDVDTLDWKYRNSASVRQRAIAGAHNRAIVLMHDIHITTVRAVAGIIDDLRAMGYEFVTVSELAAISGVKLMPGRVYWGMK